MANTFEKNLENAVKNPNLRDYFKSKYKFGSPVNAVASEGTLTLSGVVIDGETVTVDDDTYEFAADAAQSVTAGNTAVDITSHVTASACLLTVDTNPTTDDTMTIDTTVYTFKASADEAGEIPIGVDVAATQVNIVAAINGTDGINSAHASVSAGDFATNESIITALVGGVAGDSIACTETFTAGTNVFDAATLGTEVAGVDCTAALADGALILADVGTTYSMAQGTGTTVTVTAVTKGVAGDLIATTESMANGAFGQATLGDTTAGVNGTVGIAGDEYIDATYIYNLQVDNTLSDNNWRRIARGSAY